MQDNLIYKILNEKKYFKVALIIILSISVLLNILLYYIGLYSISADESGRTIDAYKWVTGTYEGVTTWLPLYTIITGFGLKIFPDLFLTPRIIISLFGLLAFTSFVWLSHELFKDRYITLLSSIIALFFPSRVVLSSVPLSESIFWFFIFSGVALFTRWLREKNNLYIIFSALLFAVSSSIRYEGWIFSVSLVIVLVTLSKIKGEKVSAKLIITAFLIIICFPVYWLIYQANLSGNPLNFFYNINTNYESAIGISFFSVLKNNFLTRFIHHNIIYLCFPGIIASVYLFLKDSTIRKWMALILISFIPLIFISFTGRGIPTHNIWRTPELWNLLLIPFTAYFIKNLDAFEFKSLRNLKKGAVPLTLIIVIIYYSFHIYRFKDEFGFSKEQLRIGRYVEQIIKNNPADNILIEVPDWSYLHIITASNHPEKFIKSLEYGNPKIIRNPVIPVSSRFELAEFAEKKIRFILAKHPELKNIIKANPFIKERISFNEWILYEIK